jgi:hypothetical protein
MMNRRNRLTKEASEDEPPEAEASGEELGIGVPSG